MIDRADPDFAQADPDYTLAADLFDGLLGFFADHYSVVSLADVIAALSAEAGLSMQAQADGEAKTSGAVARGKTAMVVGGSIRDKPSSLSIRFTPRCSSTPRPSQAAISSSVLLIFSFRVWGHSWEGEKGRRAIAVPRPFAL